MVRFFNQKEEVINIELTPYGRQQFASGTLSPAYYAFYDTSILYDGAYANIIETQNQITNRIANETPRLRPVTKFTSSLGSVFSLSSMALKDDFSQDNIWNSSFYRTLGSSDPNSVNKPSWKINLLESSDVGFNDGINYKVNNVIPEMSATLYIDYSSIPEILQEDNAVQVGPDLVLESANSFLIDVQELNTIFKGNGNFDIEVFVSGTDRISSLEFVNNKFILDSIYRSQDLFSDIPKTINGSEEIIGNIFPSIDENSVEFYLEILSDDEISEQRIPLQNSSIYKRDIDRNPRGVCDD